MGVEHESQIIPQILHCPVTGALWIFFACFNLREWRRAIGRKHCILREKKKENASKYNNLGNTMLKLCGCLDRVLTSVIAHNILVKELQRKHQSKLKIDQWDYFWLQEIIQ